MDRDYASEDEVTIDAALRALGQDPAYRNPGCERLAGGLSGSAVWRFVLDGRSVVLKITAPDVSHVLDRAWREYLFYRDLVSRVPLRTPQVIAQVADERRGVLLLMEAMPPAPPLGDWSTRDYVRVAADLGRLHAEVSGIDRGDLLGWLPVTGAISAAMVEEACTQWSMIVLPEEVEPLRQSFARMVLRVPEFDQQWDKLPDTLCHGDAHRDNLLMAEDGVWIWADWQEVRWGQGMDDLTFFWQRAFTVSASLPPIEDVLSTYREQWLIAGKSVPSLDRLAQAAVWSELRSWLIAWPPYLGWLVPEVRMRVLRRMESLARTLQLALD